MPDQPPDNRGPILFLLLLLMVGLLTVAWGVGRTAPVDVEPGGPVAPVGTPSTSPSPSPTVSPTPSPTPSPSASPTADPTASATGAADRPRPRLPGGVRHIFGQNRFLVAYYGTAETGSMGVLGESSPDEMHRRVLAAAEPFRGPKRPVQVVYELIVSIADRGPGPDGDFSHDIDIRRVERYIRAAHRNDALLLLDLQPGRSDFLTVAKRWAWALEDPWVGLALDPEWRMARGQQPGRVIGHVSAAEINRTSAWLSELTRRHHLPEKLFVLHQFRTAMIQDIDRVQPRRGLAMVQHVDGFGTRGQKRATYGAVARPAQFLMGMKLFYDEDVHRMGPPAVHALRPKVRFVSYQ